MQTLFDMNATSPDVLMEYQNWCLGPTEMQRNQELLPECL